MGVGVDQNCMLIGLVQRWCIILNKHKTLGNFLKEVIIKISCGDNS